MPKKNAHFVTLNVGNSNVSLASNQEQMVYQTQHSTVDLMQQLPRLIDQADHVLCCQVISSQTLESRHPAIDRSLKKLQERQPQKFLDFRPYRSKQNFFQMPTAYAETLGEDRLVQAYYLWKKIQGEKSLNAAVIDAGTMTTIDIVHTTQGHLGGHILPGLKIFAEIFQRADLLPKMDQLLASLRDYSAHADLNQLPVNTFDAIVMSYWKAFGLLVQKLEQQYPLTSLVLSGGHAHYWHHFLQTSKILSLQTVENNPLFIHQALWQIGADMLEYPHVKKHG